MDTAGDGAGRLVAHANRQSCCLQLDSGRSLDQIVRDFVILGFIARRRIEELARARSNIEGEALHTRHRKRARKRRQRASPTSMILRADTGCYLSPQPPIPVGRKLVCAFGNGSSELCCLCKTNIQKSGEIATNLTS